MRKITLLLMLFVASIGLNAQTWDFEAGQTDWVGAISGSLSGSTYSWDIDKKPKLVGTNLGVDADTKKYLVLTIVNDSEMTEFKMKHTKPDGSARYVKYNVDAFDNTERTYYYNLTNSNWAGMLDNIDFITTPGGNVTTSAASMIIKKIEFIVSIPTTEKHIWNFDTDGDSEDWIGIQGTTDVASGILTFNPLADQYAKLEQPLNHVDADTYNWLRVKVKNNSTGDNEIQLITDIARIGFPVTTEDSQEMTYEILLDTIGQGAGTLKWTGIAKDLTLRFGDKIVGKSTGTGSFEINSIEFFQGPSLSNDKISKDDVELTIYPNPVRNYLSVKSSSKVNTMQVYNVTGQEVLHSNASTINTSSLSKGVYVLKASLENGSISTKRFIKE